MRRLTHLALAFAVLVALAALLSSAALASSGSKPKHHSRPGCANASAICVYLENEAMSASGSNAGTNAGKLSSRLATAIAKAGGKDQALLRRVAAVGIFGHPEPGTRGSGSASDTSALGALVDLGAGPLALFATLLAGAIALAVARVLRRRRAVQA